MNREIKQYDGVEVEFRAFVTPPTDPPIFFNKKNVISDFSDFSDSIA